MLQCVCSSYLVNAVQKNTNGNGMKLGMIVLQLNMHD